MNQPNVTQAVGYWLKRTKGDMFEKGKLNVDWVLDGNKNITVNCVSSNNGAAIVFEKKQFIYLEVYTEVFKREKEKSYYHLFTFLVFFTIWEYIQEELLSPDQYPQVQCTDPTTLSL